MAFDRPRSLSSRSFAFPYRSVRRPISSSCFSPLLLESLLPGVYRVSFFSFFFFRSSNFLFIFRTRQYPRTGPGVRAQKPVAAASSRSHPLRPPAAAPPRPFFLSLLYFPNHLTIFFNGPLGRLPRPFPALTRREIL